MAPASWPLRPRGIAFGGDYNPEQWPRATWPEDVRLMQEAGVDLVTVGVFAWAWLEPEPGRFEFDWLDDVLDLLHDGGIAVDLATATASPPPWLTHEHPEILPVTVDGTTLWPGGRQAWCPSSSVYREHSLALVEQMAQRYAGHPSLVLWHVSNEMGCHNARCYCDVSAAAFRRWLRERYGDLASLNDAWGTAFWSQRYSDWEQILPPRTVTATHNPTQRLDFARFSSDSVLEQYIAERDVLRRLSPGVPVTTNLMAQAHISALDYWRWAPELDFIANDHYVDARLDRPEVELAFAADLTRGLAGGRPWMLMEHSTSAVNWQPHNLAKRPGEQTRTSLQHVARGSDSVLYFQWRASLAGSEKYHSALLPHAGTNTKVWRESIELSRLLDRIDDVAGSQVEAEVALLFDWESWWAGGQSDNRPSIELDYLDAVLRLYAALWDLGVTVDIVRPAADVSSYRLVVVPALYLVTDAAVNAIETAVRDGTSALVTYWSGIVDENDHVRPGGYPGAFRALLGVDTEEFFPLQPGQTVRLDDGSAADTWTEWVHLAGAEPVATFIDGPLAGIPAVTRHEFGRGKAWYAATRLDQAGLDRLVARVVEEAGVSVAETVRGVEVVRRVNAGASYAFVLNHTDRSVELKLTGEDLVSGTVAEGVLRVDAGGCAVVRERV